MINSPILVFLKLSYANNTIGSGFQRIMTSRPGLLDRPKSLVADTSKWHYTSDPTTKQDLNPIQTRLKHLHSYHFQLVKSSKQLFQTLAGLHKGTLGGSHPA
jgi:hypothetical protein